MEQGIGLAEVWEEHRRAISRRRFLRGAAVAAVAGPMLWRQTEARAAAPPVDPHLAVGADAATQVTVSWRTAGVPSPTQRLRYRVAGSGDGGWIDAAEPEVRTVAGAPSTYSHVALSGLQPGTTYDYEIHDAALPGSGQPGTFTSGPAAAAPFTFTALGDQGTDGAKVPPVNAAVVAQDPAFHLHVGDLCYAYALGLGQPVKPLRAVFDAVAGNAVDQQTWDTWLGLISSAGGRPAAARIPWMATVGNHDMEPTFGPHGYRGVTGRMWLPGNGAATPNPRDQVTWSFDYGGVRVIALDANDANNEIYGNQGYLGAAQDAWLEATLASARAPGSGIDWIVVGYHQCSYCTNVLHGSDAGLRSRWDGLFRTYEVDLVINGHNHSYERAHPFASHPSAPAARSFPTGSVVDPRVHGPTYLTAGAGGNERVEVSAYDVGMASTLTILGGVRIPEIAHWSAARRLGPPSFLAVDVDPAARTMTVRALTPSGGTTVELDRVTLQR